jgi:hypothetical protein
MECGARSDAVHQVGCLLLQVGEPVDQVARHKTVNDCDGRSSMDGAAYARSVSRSGCHAVASPRGFFIYRGVVVSV